MTGQYKHIGDQVQEVDWVALQCANCENETLLLKKKDAHKKTC